MKHTTKDRGKVVETKWTGTITDQAVFSKYWWFAIYLTSAKENYSFATKCIVSGIYIYQDIGL